MNQASQMASLRAGFYGKHPGFGDFVAAGLSAGLSGRLEYWLNTMLPDLRDGMGDAWEAHYDSAPMMRIWIGPALTPEGSGFCGAMYPARDKVGRRFPLLAGVEGADVPPPSVNPDQTYYEGIDDFVGSYERQSEDARGFATQFSDAILPSVGSHDPLPATEFWASRKDGDASRLWSDVKAADQIRATATRTYLWRTGAELSALYVTDGLPGAHVFAWMLGAPYTQPMRDGA